MSLNDIHVNQTISFIRAIEDASSEHICVRIFSNSYRLLA